MKSHALVTFLLLIVTNLSIAQKKNNDLQRYGLKGNVKAMYQTIFDFCKKVDGKWVATDTPFFIEKIYHFNTKGLLESLEDKHIDTKSKHVNYTITRFNYNDGKISGSIWFDDAGKKISQSTIKWLNDHRYIDIVDDKDKQMKVETEHLLDDNYRNKIVKVRRYSYNGLEAYVSTQYSYTNGILSGQVVSDSVMGYTYKYVVDPIEKDSKGNSTQTATSIQPENGMPAQLVFTKYEYYGE